MGEGDPRSVREQRGPVTIVRAVSGENRFHPGLLDELEAVLDELETSEEPAGLVLTGSGKFFSNGLDLDYMASNPDDSEHTLMRVHRMFGRLLGLEVPSVAAVNGHAFAAGAMLVLCFDQAVMREDRGWFCFPEADLGLPFTPGMNALIKARLTPAAAHEAMVLARRYTAPEALAEAIITEVAPEESVLERAVARAEALAVKPRHALAAIKRDLYAGALELLLPDQRSG